MFFRATKKPLVTMAYMLSGDQQVAQDLTQEAFLRTWSRWNRISKYDGTWIAGRDGSFSCE